jgi:ABC-2 type transport system ATP-binding protein
MDPIIEISELTKRYQSGHVALSKASLNVQKGEVLALLGPNGAGKTSLISIVCGLVRATSGRIRVSGLDIERDYRRTRAMIGLVPQELSLEPFETVEGAVTFSRGLFGKSSNPAHVEKLLRQLSLWDKRRQEVRELSGGMKRRVLIAKALSHEPSILFLDEPTAGVDVNLRRDMWNMIADLKQSGVTIVLTTHYIEEAEFIADRIAVLNKGSILLVEETQKLVRRLGGKRIQIDFSNKVAMLPKSFDQLDISLASDGLSLTCSIDSQSGERDLSKLIKAFNTEGIGIRDITTSQSNLEDIFLRLIAEEDA